MTSILSRLEELEKKATPGPWRFDNGNDDVEGGGPNRWTVCDISRGDRLGVNVDGEPDPNPTDFRDDGDFIAAIRNTAPALIAVARAAKTFCDTYDSFCEIQGGLVGRKPESLGKYDLLSALREALAALEAVK